MAKKLSFFATLPFIFVISRLPDSAFYAFSDFIAFVLRDVFHYRGKVIADNLARSFPHKTAAELQKTNYLFYQNLADTLLESLKMGSMSRQEIEKRFTLHGLDLVRTYNEQGRSVLCVAGHYSNWEWAGLAISAAYSKSPVLIIYKPMSNLFYEAYFNRLRSRFGSVMVSMKHAFKELVARRSQPSLIILVADQSPPPGKSNYHLTFLNQETQFFNGPEKLARLTNGVLVFAEINRIRRGYYDIKIVPLAEEPAQAKKHELTERHVHYLEDLIKHKPHEWLWSHRRWKLQEGS